MVLSGWIKSEFNVPWCEKYDTLPHRTLLDKIGTNTILKEHTEKVIDTMYILLNYQDKKVRDIARNLNHDYITYIEKIHNFKLIKNIIDKLDEEQKNFLLYSALYHDIGKIVTIPRHGSIGADIIKNSGREERPKFFQLGINKHDDIFFMADLIRYHDYFGTLQTGEASYLLFVEVLYPLTNNSLILERYSDKFLSYLLLINLADAFGSIKGGEEDIKEAFSIMMHDFTTLNEINKEISKLKKQALSSSHCQDDSLDFTSIKIDNIIQLVKSTDESHTYERFRRMLRSGFKRIDKISLEKYQECAEKAFEIEKENYDDQIFIIKDWFIRDYKYINDVNPIITCLRAINVKREFHTEFAFITKLDYGLGFIGDFLNEIIKTEIIEDKTKIMSPHDLRRDLAMCLVEIINTIVETYGSFTSNQTRIGIGLKRLRDWSDISEEERKNFLKRLNGEKGLFKKAEAYAKIRSDVDLWIIKP